MNSALPESLELHYESLTGPRSVEIVPVKQMGRVRWLVSGNDKALEVAGAFFDDLEGAKAAVEVRLRKCYGAELPLSWRST